MLIIDTGDNHLGKSFRLLETCLQYNQKLYKYNQSFIKKLILK